MEANKKTLGIIGGFGAFATLDFQRKLLLRFAAENEREYPHIICDNNFAMPSRTRCLLTGERHTEIVEGIAKSMRLLLQERADRIVLVCGTSHFFLPDVYKKVPVAEEKVVNMIELSGKCLAESGIKKALIVAAEGTLKRKLYSTAWKKYGISCVEPPCDDYAKIRYFIEAVKKCEYGRSIGQRFYDFIQKYETSTIVLGCTEFPVLLETLLANREGKVPVLAGLLQNYSFIDPLENVIEFLYEDMRIK